MSTLLRVQLPPDLYAPSAAREALRALPVRQQADRETLDLLVTELVTNCVRHASLAPTDHVELVVENGGDHLRVEVRDPGRAYEQALAGWARMQATMARNATPRDGFGLFIVNKESGRSGVSWDRGTLVWFELNRDPLQKD